MEIRETVITAVEDRDVVVPWPISWSAVWAGALGSLAAVTIFGLYGTAIGFGGISGIKDFSTWQEVSLPDLISVIFGVFFAYLIGGWIAGKITGARTAEPSILHGALSWLATIPALIVLLALGAGKTFGGWYGGIVGTIGSTTVVMTPAAIRHSATAAATSLLLGLIGASIGGWLACGEPMSLTHYKKRGAVTRRSP